MARARIKQLESLVKDMLEQASTLESERLYAAAEKLIENAKNLQQAINKLKKINPQHGAL